VSGEAGSRGGGASDALALNLYPARASYRLNPAADKHLAALHGLRQRIFGYLDMPPALKFGCVHQ
jgi:hypothetical protein